VSGVLVCQWLQQAMHEFLRVLRDVLPHGGKEALVKIDLLRNVVFDHCVESPQEE
jgi:hypothetical protein